MVKVLMESIGCFFKKILQYEWVEVEVHVKSNDFKSFMICRANQWAGFYIIVTSVMKGLKLYDGTFRRMSNSVWL